MYCIIHLCGYSDVCLSFGLVRVAYACVQCTIQYFAVVLFKGHIAGFLSNLEPGNSAFS